MARVDIVTGQPLIEAVGAAFDIDSGLINRVVLDAEPREPLAIYIEMAGTEKMIKKVLTAKVIPEADVG